MATEPEEGKRPGLHWPEHDLVPASRREDPEPEPEDKAADRPAPEPALPDEPLTASVLFTVASRLEGLKTSLATMGSRVEALARSEEQFREFTTARLGEHATQIADAMAAQDKKLDKVQSGLDDQTNSAGEARDALDQLRARSEEVAAALESLTGQIQAVAEDVPSLRAELIDFIARTDSRDEELAAELSRLVDEVKVLRRRMPVRAAGAASPAKRVARRVEPVEDEDDFIVEEPAPAPRRRATRARRND
ncbi:MAG TPA: hypothetical protein VMY88_06715 [Acidimicrobiales bacterium]|nr:hypothetical protein [Acidimicrobiales bacterium]